MSSKFEADPRFAELAAAESKAFTAYNDFRRVFQTNYREGAIELNHQLSAARLTLHFGLFETEYKPERIRQSLSTFLGLVDEVARSVKNLSGRHTGDALDERVKLGLSKLEQLRLIIWRSLATVDDESEAEDLLPRQRPAPIYLKSSPDRFRLGDGSAPDGDLDPASIHRFRKAAAESIKVCLSSVSDSNIDRRFREQLKSLARHLSAREDKLSIETVGVQHRIATKCLVGYKDELPTVIAAQLHEALGIVDTLLGQFSDWRAFLFYERKTALGSDDHVVAAEVAEGIAATLDENAEFAEEEISIRLREMAFGVSSGLAQRDTAIVPLIASLQNFVVEAAHVLLQNRATLDVIGKAGLEFAQNKSSYAFVLLCVGLFMRYGPSLAKLPTMQFLSKVHAELKARHPWITGAF